MGFFDFFKKQQNAVVLERTIDKAEWQWETAQQVFCQQFKIDAETLTDEEEDVVWAYAGNHMAMFITWAIMRNYIGKFHLKEDKEMIKSVKNRTKTGMDFLVECCDCVLTSEDFSKEILGFVDAYYERYTSEYSDFMPQVLNKQVLGTAFSWGDYDQLQRLIDDGLKRYKAGKFKTAD